MSRGKGHKNGQQKPSDAGGAVGKHPADHSNHSHAPARTNGDKCTGSHHINHNHDQNGRYNPASNDLAMEAEKTRAGVTRKSEAVASHTVLALLVIVMTLLVMARYGGSGGTGTEGNIKLGLCAVAFTFIGFGAVHLPDSLLARPHPAVWRAVLACGVLYVLFLTFLLFQSLDTIQSIFQFYDPSLRMPPVEREYAVDCRISTPEDPYLFFHTAFDLFVLAHSVGYVAKAFILRDWRMVTCISLGFEMLEVTLQHALSNFRECWWDHLILDVLICNTGGTIIGMWLLRKVKAKEYHWIAKREATGKVGRILDKFSPETLVMYEWNVFRSPKRFFQVAGILALLFVQELNCFTLKAMINMPHTHHLVTTRLTLWGLLAMPALREYYEYMSNPQVTRIGTNAWVTTLGLTLETILSIKMMREGGFFTELMPVHIIVPWLAAIFLFVLWMALYFGVLDVHHRTHKRGAAYHGVNLLFYAAALVIVALFMMGLPDLQIGRAQFESFVAPYEQYIIFWR